MTSEGTISWEIYSQELYYIFMCYITYTDERFCPEAGNKGIHVDAAVGTGISLTSTLTIPMITTASKYWEITCRGRYKMDSQKITTAGLCTYGVE